MDIDEAELIAQIVGGDQEAYRTLIDRYKNSVYRHCFYIVRDEDTAEDMAQTAFIKAFTQLKRYDPAKASFKTWAFTIATRECLSYLRRNKSLPLEDEDVLPSDTAKTDQLAKDHELHEAVLRLKPKYRTVSLRYWHSYTYEEIAQAMDVPVGSVRGWIFRAKKLLKEALS